MRRVLRRVTILLITYAWMRSAYLLARGPTQNCQRHVPVGDPVDVAGIADALVEAVTATAGRERRRRALIVSAVTLAVAAGLLWVVMARPPAPVAVTAAPASAVERVRMFNQHGGGRVDTEAQLRLLSFAGGTQAPDGGAAAHASEIELSLPIRRETCGRLRIIQACRGVVRGWQQDLTLAWSNTALLTIHSDDVSGMTIDPRHGYSTRIASPLVRFRFDCVRPATLDVIAPGAPSASVPVTCTVPENDRILVRFITNPVGRDRVPVPSFAMNGLATLSLQARAERAQLDASAANVDIDGDVFQIRGTHLHSLAVVAASEHEVEIKLDAERMGADSGSVEATASRATSVRDRSQELLPRVFGKQRDIWLGVLFILGGLVVAVWLELIAARR
jgi:hypothetical protein